MRIDKGERIQIVDGVADILDAVPGHFRGVRLSAALAGVGGVESERHEAAPGEEEGVEAGGLFLHAAGGMDGEDRGIFFRGIEIRREEQVAREDDVVAPQERDLPHSDAGAGRDGRDGDGFAGDGAGKGISGARRRRREDEGGGEAEQQEGGPFFHGQLFSGNRGNTDLSAL